MPPPRRNTLIIKGFRGLCAGQFFAFTLAEVLITLAIIGIIAAFTLPNLVQNYRNHVVETRLKKVYSNMNQAIVQSESESGAKELWDFNAPDFFFKYIEPYIKYVKTETIDGGTYKYLCIYFPDGSLLISKLNNAGANQDYFFYPNAKNFNPQKIESRAMSGTAMFEFRFAPIPAKENEAHAGKGFEPYMHSLTLPIDESKLKNGTPYSCKQGNPNPIYCTALIARNNWKIPKDYPFRVR